MNFTYDDGGRKAAGYKGDDVGDCIVRAIAIIEKAVRGGDKGEVYNRVYHDLYARGRAYLSTRRNPKMRRRSASPRSGVYKDVFRPYLLSLGYSWEPYMSIGSGCTVHLATGEVQPDDYVIARVSKHMCAILHGVMHDTHDCSRHGTRCVYGIFIPGYI